MRLTNIQAAGLKGQSFSLALGAITMITGGNDRGKTARTDAIRLALLGYLPEQGKTNPATFALSSGSKMTVEAQIEGRGLLTREWKQSGKTVKATTAGTEGLPETPLVALDAAEYFGKSDAGRVQMLWELLHMEHATKWTPEAAKARVLKAMGEITPELSKEVASMFVAGAGDSVQTVMERAGTWLADEAKKANDEIARWEKTAQGISQAGLADEPVDAAKVAADTAAAQAKLEDLVKDHARLRQIVAAQTKAADSERQLTAKIAELRANLGTRALPTETREALEANLASAQEALTTARNALLSHGTSMTLYREREQRAQRLGGIVQSFAKAELNHALAVHSVGELEQLLAECPEQDLQLLAEEVAVASQKRAEATAKQRSIDMATAEATERTRALLEAKCCPSCGAKGGDYEAAVRTLHEERMADLQGQACLVATEFREATAALDAATAAQQTAMKLARERQGLERRLGDAKTAKGIAQHALDEARRAGEELAALPENPEPKKPTADLDPLEAAVSDARDQLRRQRWNEELAQALDTLTHVQAGGEDDAEERHAMVGDEIEAQRQRIASLAGDQKRAANQAADKKRLAQAAAAKEVAETQAAAVARGRKELAAARAEMIKDTFGPLLDTANKFTRGILPSPLEYREGEIGRFNGGSWVPVACFGGTHKAVTYAGLQAALGASAPAKLVIMDEMGRFDRGNKARFLQNVAAALGEGVIEQFVGIDVDPEPYRQMTGLTLAEIGG